MTMRKIDAQSIDRTRLFRAAELEMRKQIRVAYVTTYLREPSEAEIQERLAILIRHRKVSDA